jgi:2-C-methyl-D-erythritol 4-phosphate cytidylyltransferase
MEQVSVIVVAAGMSQRLSGRKKKQFVEVAGRPLALWAARRFAVLGDELAEIVLVVPPEDLTMVSTECADTLKWAGVTQVVVGGARRTESVAAGLAALDKPSSLVAIHDGARPIVSAESIQSAVAAARKTGAAVVAVRVKDTLKRANDDDLITATVDRVGLWLAQTPQVFERDLLDRAFEKADLNDRSITDDAQLVERIGAQVAVVPGGYDNIKVTTPEDLRVVRALLEAEAAEDEPEEA